MRRKTQTGYAWEVRRASPITGQPVETSVTSSGRQLCIATGAGCLSLDRVQPAGKRTMDIAEFLRGHPVQVGDQFGEMG